MESNSVSDFFKLFRFSAVVSPLNVNKKKLAITVSNQLDGTSTILDSIPNVITSKFLIVYDNSHLHLDVLNNEFFLRTLNPETHIIIIIGLGTNPTKINQLKHLPSIGVIYAEFIETPLAFDIKLVNIESLRENLISTGYDKCLHETCNHEDQSYLSNDHFLDKTLGVFHFSSGVTEKLILSVIEAGGEVKKDIFIYYNSFNENHLRHIERKIKDDILFYRRLKLFCNVKISSHEEKLIICDMD